MILQIRKRIIRKREKAIQSTNLNNKKSSMIIIGFYILILLIVAFFILNPIYNEKSDRQNFQEKIDDVNYDCTFEIAKQECSDLGGEVKSTEFSTNDQNLVYICSGEQRVEITKEQIELCAK